MTPTNPHHFEFTEPFVEPIADSSPPQDVERTTTTFRPASACTLTDTENPRARTGRGRGNRTEKLQQTTVASAEFH